MTDVLIRHKKDGTEYAINVADFRRGKHALNDDGELVTYEDAGYEIVHEHPSGLPYEALAARVARDSETRRPPHTTAGREEQATADARAEDAK